MYLFYILVCLCFMEENLYRGGEKKRPSIKKKKKFSFNFYTSKSENDSGTTIYRHWTQDTLRSCIGTYINSCECNFDFLNFFIYTASMEILKQM